METPGTQGKGCWCHHSPDGRADCVQASGPLTVVQRTCPGLTACHLPRPQAQAGASPASMSTPRARAVPQWRLLCMDGTAFG